MTDYKPIPKDVPPGYVPYRHREEELIRREDAGRYPDDLEPASRELSAYDAVGLALLLGTAIWFVYVAARTVGVL